MSRDGGHFAFERNRLSWRVNPLIVGVVGRADVERERSRLRAVECSPQLRLVRDVDVLHEIKRGAHVVGTIEREVTAVSGHVTVLTINYWRNYARTWGWLPDEPAMERFEAWRVSQPGYDAMEAWGRRNVLLLRR